jgi:sugar transferase (PEP-CTERM/EpsH1 system associated)
MKVFVLLSRVPWPLEKGDKLRAYHQVKHLAARHHVVLCCLNVGKIHPDARTELEKIAPEVHIIPLHRWKIVWRMCRALWSDKPFQVHYFLQNRAKNRVHHLIAATRPDHCYAQLIRTAEYVKNLHHLKKTLDYMDAFSAGQDRKVTRTPYLLRWLPSLEASRLRLYENLIFDYFDHHTIISAQDRALLRHPGRNNIAVVPNGVDYAYFSPRGQTKTYDIVFTGNMSYPPNIDCAQFLVHAVLPLVWKRLPGATLLICGATPHNRVQQLEGERVTVQGWVEDIREAYGSAKVFAAPMQIGTGMQNKLLEAMSMALPCVTSPLACGGLGIMPGNELLSGSTAEEVAGQISDLLTDETRRSAMGLKARAFVMRTYDWETATLQLERIMLGENHDEHERDALLHNS